MSNDDHRKPPGPEPDRLRPFGQQTGPTAAPELYALTHAYAKKLFPHDPASRLRWLSARRAEISEILDGPGSADPSATAADIGSYLRRLDESLEEVLSERLQSSALGAFTADQRDPVLRNAMHVYTGLSTNADSVPGWRYVGRKNINPTPFTG